jgi:hypothetical protein
MRRFCLTTRVSTPDDIFGKDSHRARTRPTVLIAGGPLCNPARQATPRTRANDRQQSGESRQAGAAGADAIINYREEDLGERVKVVTDGRGLPIRLPSPSDEFARLAFAIIRPPHAHPGRTDMWSD